MAKVPNALEILRKLQPPEYRVHERYRRQTDGRATANSERERSPKSAENFIPLSTRSIIVPYQITRATALSPGCYNGVRLPPLLFFPWMSRFPTSVSRVPS